MNLNQYIITTRQNGEVVSHFNGLTQRTFKTLRAARTDVRECLQRKLALEKAARGEGTFNAVP